jgi:3-hydroxyacyl-CoA dehydrogenase
MSHLHHEVRGTLAPAGINAAAGNRQIHELGQDQDRDLDRDRYAADLLADLSAQGRAVGRVGIIGANAVGIGIALSLLDAGVPVTLLEFERASLDSGIALARSGYPDARDTRMALLTGTVYFHHLKDCDLIVDAVCTGTTGKEKLFRRLDQVVKPGAVLVTHASHTGVDHIAGCTRRRGEVLGLHVAHSSNTGATWQIVPGKDTSSETLVTVIALARRLHGVIAVCDLRRDIAIDAKSATRHLDSVAPWKIDRAWE